MNALLWILAIMLGARLATAQAPVATGPVTEKRFPPLQVPPQFKATLFACDPLLEYPSVLALGPHSNSIFLAHDYMTGLGEKIVRRDEIRLVEDTDGDGYADKSTVWAGGFNSIQGLAYHDGRVFVMHAPLLTVLRDSNGDGVADERGDVLRGLGWAPEKTTDRLHGANGVTVGHDGWLYLALGDRGCDVRRPEGDQLVLNGGGILRCRRDGSDLHIFSTGLRNIYDIALDDELNVFVRDNENDGGNYMVRVCHSFMGADHGYPYLYQDHPDEAVAPLADLGRGSSAGGVAYLERSFPALYQNALFFCEWGKSVVWYGRERNGSGFAAMKETEFAAGASNDPYGFRPTDIIVDRDGSLLVSDWADGQRPKRGRGRVYRIRYEGEQSRVTGGLDSSSYQARSDAQTEIEGRGRAGVSELKKRLAGLNVVGRIHAVWIVAHAGDSKTLFDLAERDSDPRVRAQAVRALADLFDPVLVQHRIDAARGDPKIAQRLAALGRGQDARVRFEVTVALGRLRWSGAPEWLRANLGTPDPTLAHAVLQTLRRSGNWPAVLAWLDAPDNSPLRPLALRALAGQAEAAVVDGLIRRVGTAQEPKQRREYGELLCRVQQKPGPWVYWGFRPGPRPPNPVAWERTQTIQTALDRLVNDPERAVRLAMLQQMEREKIPVRSETVTRWLRTEKRFESISAILSSYEPSNARPPKNDTGSAPKSMLERHARLSQLALAGGGDPVRGREIFLAEKSACSKCHRFGDLGRAVGPDLTGAGRRFPRIHIIESILEPSRAIAPAFRNLSIRMKDGQEFTGVRVAETESTLTLGDAQGQGQELKKEQIEDLQILALSIMPEGLESGLTDEEFVDLVAFLAEQPKSKRITAPLRTSTNNPNYFTDGQGRPVYLTGSHTWNNVQDWGTDDSPQPFDFAAYVSMLVAHHHNFTLLWQTELPVFRGLPTRASDSPDFCVTPQPWSRAGPGYASDGKLKFALTRFNQAYFDRLRDRVQQLNGAGIYAGVYLFSGEWLLRFRFPGDGYPLTGSNNVNGVDDGGGTGSVTMSAPNALTDIQDAFVRKLIDTLNDLPNVLWIVSQEAPPGSEWWNSHLLSLTRAYEAGKPLQHPIGFGVLADNNDGTILNSDADWIAPAAKISPTRSCGRGHPACKVNINDSDHSYFGMWNDSAQVNRNFFWLNFTQGNQTLFMDPYVVFYPRENRNLSPSPGHGIGAGPDPRWDNVRDTMGYIRGYAERLDLAAVAPRGDLSSTKHALANTNSVHPEFLVYAPSGGSFTVELSAVAGALAVEWMNPATGVRTDGASVSGGSTFTFTPPFSGDAVLYLSRKTSDAGRK